MRNTNFYETTLILIILIGTISLSFANNMSGAIIHNTGRIIAEISAGSGSAKDIQEAVDLAATLGVGIVRIPEGTFNFVEVGEPWKTLNVPAGVSIFGAPTERDANGQVVEWKTVLVMPWDVPSGTFWFQIVGNSDPNKPSRFSDIKLVGYRSFNSSSITTHGGLMIISVINFRVDHCRFEHTCAGAIGTQGHYCSGVIDHCELVNDYGMVAVQPQDSTVKYGIAINRQYHGGETSWEPDITKILGKYLNYTVFVEDCYFTRWRHCVAGGLGAHYVVRHCIFEETFSFGEIDTHPSWDEPSVPNRAAEVYENEFTAGDSLAGAFAIQWNAGGGVIFNNTVNPHSPQYPSFVKFGGGSWNSSYDTHDVYLWENDIDGVGVYIDGSRIEGEDYFLYEPDWYMPYQYPHPLTSS